jgi:hypothetical protein
MNAIEESSKPEESTKLQESPDAVGRSSNDGLMKTDETAAASEPNGPSRSTKHRRLTGGELVLAALFLVMWLVLFGGGITMDTGKFRCAISTGGASALAAEAQPGEAAAKDVCQKREYADWIPVGWSWLAEEQSSTKQNPSGTTEPTPASTVYAGQTSNTHRPKLVATEKANAYRLLVAWLGVLLFFLPLNLAMVSATAGALGALGNKANLEDDRPEPSVPPDQQLNRSTDISNPIMSGLLRGLFVYLFFISGLLLFDDKPFSSPGPGQYIRLAGFISLISFLINYRPHLFTTISDWAFERINSRKVIPKKQPEENQTQIEATEETTKKKTFTVKTATNGEGEALPKDVDVSLQKTQET